MCGINLAYGEANVRKMNNLLAMRGIRSNVTHIHKGFYLGHVRLPIQGLDPFWDHPLVDGPITGAFVGEFLNHKEFFPEHSSDCYSLVKGYNRQGIELLEKIDGFFSAIFYDQYTETVRIYTDPLAKKPLYIREYPFAISSEIKSLVSLAPVTFDELYFSTVAKWGYFPEDRTPFNEIKKIPPYTQLIIKLDKGGYACIELKNRWGKLEPNPQIDLYSALKTAVENRMVSDVPISLLMSGGLDSTIIYYLMRQFTDSITIYHIDNEEAPFLDYIPFRPKDKLIKVDINKFDHSLEEILYMNDGPVDLGSMVPQYLLGRELFQDNMHVCLSGDGADELFGGYKRSMDYDSQYSDIFHELVYYHLPRLDKMMAGWRVELRNPFLARPVIEKALSLPWCARQDKVYLKELAKEIGVPYQIINRAKYPLKLKKQREGKLNWRYELIKTYRRMYERR